MKRIEIRLHDVAPWISGNEWGKLHWAVKAEFIRAYATTFRMQTHGLIFAPLVDVHFEAIRYSTGRRLDYENVRQGLKPVLDALVIPSKRNPRGIGIIVDDSPIYITKFTDIQEKIVKADIEQARSEFILTGTPSSNPKHKRPEE